MKPFWVTFYSYKGGVGRSMAVANLATLLARRSRRVFLIDFDLEAPGLDSFQDFGVEPGHPGVVEYAHEFQETNVAPGIEGFVQECKFKRPVIGKVWLMPSGRKDHSYNKKRVALNWQGFYDRGVGEDFFANWKAAVYRNYKPDYVFVDSRTGLTDVGGICTLHLPDLVVLLFGLNDQNLNGTAGVLQTIRDAAKDKPPQVIPVATPVPNSPRTETGLFKSRMDQAEKLLGIEIKNTITYNPQAALAERLFTLEGPTALETDFELARPPMYRIVDEYLALLRAIQDRDQDGLDSLIRKAAVACENENEDRVNQIKQVMLEDFGDRADALYEVGQMERRFKGREQAVEFWQRAFEADHSHAEAFRSLLAYHKHRKDHDSVLRLHAARLDFAKRYDPETVEQHQSKLAEDLIAMGRYEGALEQYHEIAVNTKAQDPYGSLVDLFNESEAARRAQRRIDAGRWPETIQAFEELKLESLAVGSQANVFQAMHIAYACIGELEKAKEMLQRAASCATSAGKAGEFFCVKSYSHSDLEQFLNDNKEMAEALDRGQLWDGMPLSPDT